MTTPQRAKEADKDDVNQERIANFPWLSVVAGLGIAASVVTYCWADIQQTAQNMQQRISSRIQGSVNNIANDFKQSLNNNNDAVSMNSKQEVNDVADENMHDTPRRSQRTKKKRTQPPIVVEKDTVSRPKKKKMKPSKQNEESHSRLLTSQRHKTVKDTDEEVENLHENKEVEPVVVNDMQNQRSEEPKSANVPAIQDQQVPHVAVESAIVQENDAAEDTTPDNASALVDNSDEDSDQTSPIQIKDLTGSLTTIQKGSWIGVVGEEDDGQKTVWKAFVLDTSNPASVQLRYLRKVRHPQQIVGCESDIDKIFDIFDEEKKELKYVFYEKKRFRKCFRIGPANILQVPFLLIDEYINIRHSWKEDKQEENMLVSLSRKNERLLCNKFGHYLKSDSDSEEISKID